MANPRNEIEAGIVTALQPLKAAGKLKWLEAIGAQDYATLLRAAIGAAPFVVVKYTGKVPETQPGGLVRWSAEISLLVGASSLKSLTAKRLAIHDLLYEIEDTLGGLRIQSAAGADVYYPLIPGPEQWSEMSGINMEVWEQRYEAQWEEDYGRF